MKYDLVIYNAKIVTEEEVFLGYICVSDGKIAAMGSDAPVYEAAQSLDAKGMLLLPGARSRGAGGSGTRNPGRCLRRVYDDIGYA